MHQMSEKKSSCSSSLKKPSQKELANRAIQLTKRVPKPGKLGKEIDDIFAGRKKKKPELENPVKEEETKAEIAKKKRKRNQLDGLLRLSNNPKTRPRKRTEDGLLVFTEEELGINKAYAVDGGCGSNLLSLVKEASDAKSSDR